MKYLLAILSLIPSLVMAQQTDQFGRISRIQNTQWGQIDLATYTRQDRWGRPCRCSMCGVLNQWKARYYQQQRNPPQPQVSRNVPSTNGVPRPAVEAETKVSEQLKSAGEQPSSDMIQRHSIDFMKIESTDVIGELGCGRADFCIRAVQAGAKLAYGFEIDEKKAAEAKANVVKAESENRIPVGSVIIMHGNGRGDVRQVDLKLYGITKGYAYLYHELLVELQAAGKFDGLKCLVSPLHDIESMPMSANKVGEDWVYVYREGVTPEPQPFEFHPIVETEESNDVFSEVTVSQQIVGTSKEIRKQIKNPWTRKHLKLIMKSMPNCDPCNRFILTQEKSVQVKVEHQQFGAASYPYFQLQIWNGKSWNPLYEWNGFTTAEAINRHVQQELDRRNGL